MRLEFDHISGHEGTYEFQATVKPILGPGDLSPDFGLFHQLCVD